MHPAENGQEMLQCYDEDGNPTEARVRAEVKKLPYRWWYAVARVWLVNDAGQIMVSKRSEQLASSAGKWQSYFGGHVGAGHSILDTAQRELAEEAGVERSADHFVVIDQGHREDKKVHYISYAVRFNGQPSDLHFADYEVTEAKWMDLDAYWKAQAEDADHWCNTCGLEQQQKIREWVAGFK